jgi:hypothetical protein
MPATSRRDPELLVFLAVAFGAAWLFALPLWESGTPIDSP